MTERQFQREVITTAHKLGWRALRRWRRRRRATSAPERAAQQWRNEGRL